jgi:uncharacterized membrane protein
MSAPFANDLSHITLGNFKFQHNSIATFRFGNRNLLWLINQGFYNIRYQILHRAVSPFPFPIECVRPTYTERDSSCNNKIIQDL